MKKVMSSIPHAIIALLLLVSQCSWAQLTSGSSKYMAKAPSMKFTAFAGLDLAGNDLTKASSLAKPRFMGGVNIGLLIRRNILVGLDYAGGSMKSSRDEMTGSNTFHSALARVEGRLPLPRSRFVLYGFLRAGAIFFKPELQAPAMPTGQMASTELSTLTGSNETAFAYGFGLGSEVMISRRVSFQIETGLTTTTSDKLENLEVGTKKDGWTYLNVGFSWYLPFRGAR